MRTTMFRYRKIMLYLSVLLFIASCASSTIQPPTNLLENYDFSEADVIWDVEATQDIIVFSTGRGVYQAIRTTGEIEAIDESAGTIRDLELCEKMIVGGNLQFWVWDIDLEQINILPDTYRDFYFHESLEIVPSCEMIISIYTRPSPGINSLELWYFEDQSSEIIELGERNPSQVQLNPIINHIIAFTEVETNEVIIYDLESRTIIRRLVSPYGNPQLLDWSNDGDKLVVALASGLIVWNVSNWEESHIESTNQQDMRSLALHPTGSHVATAGSEGTYIWNLETGESSMIQNESSTVVHWIGDGGSLISATSGGLQVWNIDNLP